MCKCPCVCVCVPVLDDDCGAFVHFVYDDGIINDKQGLSLCVRMLGCLWVSVALVMLLQLGFFDQRQQLCVIFG